MQKQIRRNFYKTQLKKYVKTALQKLCFKLNFYSGSRHIKRSLVCYQTPCCVVSPQTQKLAENKRSLTD